MTNFFRLFSVIIFTSCSFISLTAQQLDVEGNGLFYSPTNHVTLTLDTDDTNDNASITVRSGSDIWSFGAQGSEGFFKISGGALGSLDHFTMNNDGEVGIGTIPTAGADLSVSGPGTSGHLIIRENNNSGNADLRFANFGVTNYFSIIANASPSNQFGDPQMNFVYNDNGTDKIALTVSGDKERVGINMPNEDEIPEYTLVVEHGPVSPALGNTNYNNGLSIKNTDTNQNAWVFYTRNGADQLGLYYDRVTIGNFLTDGTYAAGSDRKLKKDIQTLDGQLDNIMRLRPTTYFLKHEKNGRKNFGLIAQELQEIYPEMVTKIQTEEEDGEVTLGVSYAKLIPVLIAGMQEQQQLIESKDLKISNLKNQLSQVEDRLASIENVLKQLSSSTVSINTPVETHQQINLEVPFLEQNAPNPFNGTTTIRYYLPKENQAAVLQIMNVNGQVLTTRALEGQGLGTITLNIGEMPEGSYSYALLVNGKVVDTKQMVVVK